MKGEFNLCHLCGKGRLTNEAFYEHLRDEHDKSSIEKKIRELRWEVGFMQCVVDGWNPYE